MNSTAEEKRIESKEIQKLFQKEINKIKYSFYEPLRAMPNIIWRHWKAASKYRYSLTIEWYIFHTVEKSYFL